MTENGQPDRGYDCDVAIVGAGPTGLTLAHLLGQAGVRVMLIERNATTVQAPRAVSIDDESLRTMQAISLEKEILAITALDYGAHYYTPSGKIFAKIEPPNREYGFPRRSAFSQPVLEAVLRDALPRHASVEALFRHELQSIHEDEEGVTLDVATPDGTQRTIRAKYLAGCDGGRSQVRKHIGATLQGTSYVEKWLIVDLAETKERMRQTRVLCNPDRPAICLPGPDGIRRYEFMLHEGEVDEEMERPEKVRELLAADGPDADSKVVRRQVYTFHARVCDKWNTKRILIGGDAAHLTPPFAGQGMNSGVRDAHAMSWRLAGVVKGELGPGAIESYHKERAPHARALIDMAINIGRVMMPSSHVQAFLVHSAFRLMRYIPPLHAYFAQMKYKPKPYYQEGFIDPDPQSKLTGRMLSQPLVEHLDRRREKLDYLLGNGFVLLAYGEKAQEHVAASKGEDFGFSELNRIAVCPMRLNIDRAAPQDVLAVRDVEDFFGTQFPPGQDILVVVRPDRYIMAAAHIRNKQDISAMAERVRQVVASTRP